MEFLLTLRRRGIADKAVLRAMDEVPRERFVETSFADAAYADQALPIAATVPLLLIWQSLIARRYRPYLRTAGLFVLGGLAGAGC